MWDNEKREAVILTLCKRKGLVVESYEDIPRSWIEFYDHIKYGDLITPLVKEGKDNGLSYRQMSIKYNVTVRTIQYICCCKPIYNRYENQ